MPRKQFVADLQCLIDRNVARKSEEDGCVAFTCKSGAVCVIIFLSICDYPKSEVLLTTEDDKLAVKLSSLKCTAGSISEIIQRVEMIEPEQSQLRIKSSWSCDGFVYYWQRIPFSNAALPDTVLRAMNIAKTDDLLMCAKFDEEDVSSSTALQLRFFCVSRLISIYDDDVQTVFRATDSLVNYRKLYFEWTLIDYTITSTPSTASPSTSPATIFHHVAQQVEKRLGTLHTSCTVCHMPFEEGLEVVKPTVCSREFCSYRFVEYGLGADIPYQILHSPYVVDMLIQFTYAASASNDTMTLEHTFGDHLSKKDIADIIDKMPAVTEMQKWVHSKRLVANLDSIDKTLYPLLRWILCTNTSFIEEISLPSEKVAGISHSLRQFRIASSSLTKEYAFRLAKKQHAEDTRSLHAFHGSGVQNWHSILRNGLHYQKTTNGRAKGNGIYHALDTGTSSGYCRSNVTRSWKNATLSISSCFTLNELVNAPNMFVSRDPYLVVADVDWVQLRYIFVAYLSTKRAKKVTDTTKTLNKHFTEGIPSRKYLDLALQLRSDTRIVWVPSSENAVPRKRTDSSSFKKSSGAKINDLNDLKEPNFATPFASKTIMRDILNFTKNQIDWLEFDPQSIENMYRWTVKLTNFDASLPIAKDLDSHQITGITLELCFGPNYPLAPPFIRVVSPRMLQFCHGGGGHVTAGGSICMDLLTDSGWMPSYTLESVLLQVKMALSSLDPRPARIDRTSFNTAYSRDESWNAFTRVARDHGWKVDANGKSFYV